MSSTCNTVTYNTELALSVGERVSLKLTAPPPPLGWFGNIRLPDLFYAP